MLTATLTLKRPLSAPKLLIARTSFAGAVLHQRSMSLPPEPTLHIGG